MRWSLAHLVNCLTTPLLAHTHTHTHTCYLTHVCLAQCVCVCAQRLKDGHKETYGYIHISQTVPLRRRKDVWWMTGELVRYHQSRRQGGIQMLLVVPRQIHHAAISLRRLQPHSLFIALLTQPCVHCTCSAYKLCPNKSKEHDVVQQCSHVKPEHRRVDFFHALSKKHINYVCILITLLIWQFSFNSTELSKHPLRHPCDFLTCDYAVSDHFHCSRQAFFFFFFFRQLLVSKRKAQIKSLYATSEHGKQMSPTFPLRRSEELKGEWIADEC